MYWEQEDRKREAAVATARMLQNAEGAAPSGSDFEVNRSYRSDSGFRGYFGRGWENNFSFRAMVDPGNLLTKCLGGVADFYQYDVGSETYLNEPLSGYFRIDEVGNKSLTRFNGIVYYFDSNWLVSKRVDCNGNALTFLRDGEWGVTKILDSQDREYDIYMDNNTNVITRITDVGGRSVSYYYDVVNLTKVVYPDGTSTGYSYDGSHRLTGKVDGKGEHYLENIYDGQGRVTKQFYGNHEWTAVYDDGAGVATATDFAGNATVYEYDFDDELGDVYAITKITEATNRDVRSGEGNYSVSLIYDDEGRVSKKLLADGTEMRFSYDDNFNLLNVQRVGGSQTRTESRSYDSSNRITRVTDARGNSTKYYYDNHGNLVTQISTVTYDGAQGITKAYFHNEYGQITREVNPEGEVIDYEYYDSGSNEGYLEKVRVDPDGLNLEWEMKYDTVGNITEKIDPESNKTWEYYDAGRKLTKKVRILDNSDTSRQYAESYYYDANRLLASKVVEHKDQSGSSMTLSEHVFHFYYDSLDRITGTVFEEDALGRIRKTLAEYAYDGNGNILTQTSAEGREYIVTYDERNLKYTTAGCSGCGGGTAGSQYYYDGSARVTKIVDANGNSVRYVYDGLGQATRVAYYDNAGTPALLSYEEVEYDLNGNPTEKTVRDASDTIVARSEYDYDELNRVYQEEWAISGPDVRVRYLYDKASRLTKEKRYLSGSDVSPTLAETVYVYDNAGRLITKTDPEGNSTAFAYDKAGRLTGATDPESNSTALSYDRVGRATRVTNAASHYTVVDYDSRGNVLTTISYNSASTALAKQASAYDGLGRRITMRRYADPTGAADDTKDEKVVAYYDGDGLVTKITDPNGNHQTAYYNTNGQLEWGRDPLGNKIEYAYDSNNNVITTVSYEIDQINGATKTFTTVQVYDGRNRVTKTINQGADGDITTITDNGETVAYYDARGQVTKVTDPLNVSTGAFYDKLGRLTRVTADAGGIDAWRDVVYDRGGRVITSTDPNGNSTTYLYDKNSRLTRPTDPLGNYTVYTHDGNGNVITSVAYEIDMVDSSTKSFTTAMLYDALGALITHTDQGADGDITATADNGITIAWYDGLGRVTKATDPESVSTAWLHDGLSRMTRQIEDVGGIARNTDMVYDKAGKTTRLTDDLGENTDYAYDERGRLSLTTYADAGTVATCYAFGSSPFRIIDQRNITKRFDYDGLGRLLTKGDKWTSSDIIERYEYDAGGRIITAILTNGGTEQAEVAFTYDNLGRPTRQSLQIKGGTTRHADSVYDDLNRLTLTYPQAKNVAYTYDANNRVSRILDGANARALYKYVGPSRLSEKTLLNGASTVSTLRMTYDGVAQITSALYRNSGDTATIIGFLHDFDKMSNPDYEVRVHQSNYGDEYTYDNLYRITRAVYDDSTPTTPTASPAATTTDDWLLDDIGNRTKVYAKSATPTEYEHNAVNEYTSVGGTGYEYDAAGNLTKDDTHYYYWDYENRLTKVVETSGSTDVAEYTYDAFMRRVEKVDKAADPDVTTQFFYDAWQVIEERQTDGTLNATYINGAGLDEPILMNRDSTDYWYMQSLLNGSVAALVDSSGDIQEAYKYRAYGAPTIITGTGNDSTWFTSDDTTASTSAIGNPYMYTARRYDEETGFMYFRLRMYQPETGSFISRDPIGYVDGMSLYLGYFAPGGRDALGLEKEGVKVDEALRELCEDLRARADRLRNIFADIQRGLTEQNQEWLRQEMWNLYGEYLMKEGRLLLCVAGGLKAGTSINKKLALPPRGRHPAISPELLRDAYGAAPPGTDVAAAQAQLKAILNQILAKAEASTPEQAKAVLMEVLGPAAGSLNSGVGLLFELKAAAKGKGNPYFIVGTVVAIGAELFHRYSPYGGEAMLKTWEDEMDKGFEMIDRILKMKSDIHEVFNEKGCNLFMNFAGDPR